MNRYFIDIAYYGAAFHGWQRQPNAVSVQEVVERAMSVILRSPIDVTAAGRTDAGVHALAMTAHFDAPMQLDGSFVYRLNSLLHSEVAVSNLRPVVDDAHARFSAQLRTYQYHAVAQKDPFLADRALRLNRIPNIELMNRAAEIMIGKHDFQSFSKVHTDVNNFICTVDYARWEERDGQLIFTITANRFLRNMVRAVVGTLLDVGFGKTTIEQFKQIIESRNRSNAGESIAPHGLFFVKADYPNEIFITSNSL